MASLYRPAPAFLRGHGFFLALLTAGALLRVLVSVAYAPALLLQRDAYAYLNQAENAGPAGGFRPAFYPLVLKPLLAAHNVALVPAAQHLIALGLAALLYALLRRNRVGPVAAALGTAPLLLDPYQVDLEQYVLAETVFEALTVGALALLLWRRPPSIAAAALCGLLLVGAGLTRYAGLALFVPALAFLLVTRAGVVRAGALVAAFALPLIAYSALGPSLSSGGPAGRVGFFMFGRVLPFAGCPHFETDPELRNLMCDRSSRLSGHRNEGYFAMKDLLGSLIRRPGANETLLAFSEKTIEHQPLDYVAAVGSDYGRYFDTTGPQTEERFALKWRFITTVAQSDPLPYIADRHGDPPHGLGFSQQFRIDRALASALWSYQSRVYTWGPLLGLLIVLGLAGSIAGRSDPAGIAAGAGLLGWSAVVLLLFPVAVTVFHFRYTIPALPLAGPAGAAGAAALLRWIRQRRP